MLDFPLSLLLVMYLLSFWAALQGSSMLTFMVWRTGSLGVPRYGWWFRNPVRSPVDMVIFPIICRVYKTSQVVVWNFWTINSRYWTSQWLIGSLSHLFTRVLYIPSWSGKFFIDFSTVWCSGNLAILVQTTVVCHAYQRSSEGMMWKRWWNEGTERWT